MSAYCFDDISRLRHCGAIGFVLPELVRFTGKIGKYILTYLFLVRLAVIFRYGRLCISPSIFAVPAGGGAPARRAQPLLALACLIMLVLLANNPALAGAWDGPEMAPLPQYRTYCQTYGDHDPGCAPALGGRAGPLSGPDRLIGKQYSLSMAVHIHRQVVADLIYVQEKQDVWQVLGSIGTGMTGDCDDVVMTTITRLLRRGYPRGALRATIVELPDGGGHHLILGVRLAQGEVFLDDRHRWQRTADELRAQGYRFVAQEVPGQPFWHRPGEPAAPDQSVSPPSGEVAALPGV
jgi:hypothetical protein